MTASGFQAGDLVRVTERAEGARFLTEAERTQMSTWREYMELDSAGETRLVPRLTRAMIEEGEILTVIKARVRCPTNWGKPRPGFARLLSSKTGHDVYLHRSYLEPVK